MQVKLMPVTNMKTIHLPLKVSSKAALFSRVKAQRGFSLLELMIGLTIGLLVSMLATSSLISTTSTQKTVSEATGLQQQASMVMRIVGSMVRQAGGNELKPASYFVQFDSKYNGYNAAGVDVNVTGVEGGGSSDTLRISTTDITNAGVSIDRDCLGNPTAFTGVRIDNQLSVTGGNLMCLGSGNATPQALAEGVEDFQVRYGVASNGGGGGAIQKIQYKNANTVTDWGKVRAVQVCLRISAASNGNAGGGSVVTGCDGATVTADGKLRKVFNNTFFLRNSRRAL